MPSQSHDCNQAVVSIMYNYAQCSSAGLVTCNSKTSSCDALLAFNSLLLNAFQNLLLVSISVQCCVGIQKSSQDLSCIGQLLCLTPLLDSYVTLTGVRDDADQSANQGRCCQEAGLGG